MAAPFTSIDELTDSDCEYIALSRFNLKLFDGESELQQVCWFDYRHDHPVKRTYRFAFAYMRSYQALYEKYINIDSEQIYGLSRPNDPLDNEPPRNKTARLRTPTCLWRARQVADGLSVPYEFYTRNALQYLFEDRFFKQILGQNAKKKVRLNIQASAMYSQEVIEHVEKKWAEQRKARMAWSDNPRLCFTESEIAGTTKSHPYKLALERFIIKEIAGRTVKEFAIDNAITRRVLRPVVAAKVFNYHQAANNG